jgi:hypothetical protein
LWLAQATLDIPAFPKIGIPMALRFCLLATLFTVLLAGCQSGPEGNGNVEDQNPGGDTESEAWATKMYGDARVYYFVKQGARGVKGASQKEIRYTLINRTHSLYRGLPDSQLRADEYYISNADMMDVLNGLRKKCEFFELSREIGSRDPFALAQSQPYSQTERFIAVEIIKDGVVNCAYMPRQPINDEILKVLSPEEKERLRRFSDAQDVIVFYTRYALPRGTSSTGRPAKIDRR